MLRTFIIIGLVVLAAGALFGAVLGIAGSIVGFLIKVALLGAVVYLAIRIISPRTAHRLREKIEHQTLPRL